MMGASHAVSGAAAWAAVTSLGVIEADMGTVLVGAIVCAGAALLPDADHPNATIAQSIPIAGKAVAGAVGGASGGHRQGMHSLLATVAVIFGMIYLGRLTVDTDWGELSWGAGIAAACCVSFAVKVLGVVKSWILAWPIGLAAGLLVAFVTPGTTWLPWCVGAGYLVHLLGDAITTGGVPFAWPIVVKPSKVVKHTPLGWFWRPNGALAVPLLGDTGSWREWLLSVALGVYAVWGLSVACIATFA